MAFGSTQKDNANTPIGSVYVPNTASSDLTPLRGANTSTDANGQKSAAGSMVIENANPNGQNTMVNSAPVVIASNQTAVPQNLSQIGGTAVQTGVANFETGGFMPSTLWVWAGGTSFNPIRDVTQFGDPLGSGVAAVTAMGLSSPNNFSYLRTPTVFKAFNAQALTATAANTPTSIWTPTTGKSFRLMGYSFSSSVAASLVFHDLATVGGTGLMPLPSPVLAAAGVYTTPPIGNGILSAAVNNKLWVDATTACTVTGFVWGTEE